MNKKVFFIPLTMFLALSLGACKQKSHNSNEPSQNQNTSSVSGVSLNYEALTMYVGKSATLTATVEPDTNHVCR